MATMYIFFAKLINIFKISIPSSFEYLNFRAKNGKVAPPYSNAKFWHFPPIFVLIKVNCVPVSGNTV